MPPRGLTCQEDTSPWRLPTSAVWSTHTHTHTHTHTEVAQSCPTLCDPMDCSPPGSSVHGIFQARILEWVLFPSPMQSLKAQCCCLHVGQYWRAGPVSRLPLWLAEASVVTASQLNCSLHSVLLFLTSLHLLVPGEFPPAKFLYPNLCLRSIFIGNLAWVLFPWVLAVNRD